MFREVTKIIHRFRSSREELKQVLFHRIFIICLLSFYENDSAILTEKKLFLDDCC